ncbi:MAG: SUMF1/EgtB/PvdO family nonheme iron enzyme [Planctomycetes bacterium]|nr:SUMF1/EgtB/PvdO family nonheme iron enzyme [Planctomycetota bacterium]
MFYPKSHRSAVFIATIILLAAGSARSIESDPIQSAITMEFVRIPAGSFYMEHAHHVQFTKPFYMGKYEVTQAQWKTVMGTTVSQQHQKATPFWHLKGVGPEHPIYYVSWEEAAEFCKRLGTNFRLPDESEWEYACRAGSKTRFHYGDDPNYSQLGLYAWYYDNSKGQTHPVGQKKPNKWDLYDMHGNVAEWCSDRHVSYSFSSGGEAGHVCRGGSWLGEPEKCQSSYGQFSSRPFDAVGFRIVFTGNVENDKKVLKITMPKKTADLNIFQKLKSKIKSDTSMAIKGVVRDQTGIPIEGTYMEILPPQGWEMRQYSEGRFEAYQYDDSYQTSTGKYQFFARHPQQNLFAFIEFDEDVNNLDIRLEPAGNLTGKIVDSHGQGIQNAKINTILQGSDWRKPFSLLPLWVEANAEGEFQIRAIPLGHKYKLIAIAKGYRKNEIDINSENVSDNRIDTGPIVLARGQFTVSGIVVDKNRKPVADALVKCWCEKDRVDIYTKTDSKGRFKADGIFEGPVIIFASNEEKSSGILCYGQKHSTAGATNVMVVLRQKTN